MFTEASASLSIFTSATRKQAKIVEGVSTIVQCVSTALYGQACHCIVHCSPLRDESSRDPKQTRTQRHNRQSHTGVRATISFCKEGW